MAPGSSRMRSAPAARWGPNAKLVFPPVQEQQRQGLDSTILKFQESQEALRILWVNSSKVSFSNGLSG